MQFGYGKKNKKKKVKKAKGSKAGPSGDDVMADVEVAHPDVAQMEDVAQESAMSARDKQRHKMELKTALRVRVNSLKSSRNKITKSKKPVSKESKLNMKAEVKQLLQEQLNLGKPAST